MGARFAKWARGDPLWAMAFPPGLHRGQPRKRWLAMPPLCQEAGWSPSSSRSGSWTASIPWSGAGRAHGGSPYERFFLHLYTQGVTLEGMILKPNMVLPGLTCPSRKRWTRWPDATVRCLLRSVPAAVPGIAFLSGGQSPELARPV